MLPGWLSGSVLKALAGVAAAAALAIAGYWQGYEKADALGRAELADIRRQHADALTAAHTVAHERYVGEVEYGLRLAKQLAGEREAYAAERKELLGRISDVTTVYVPHEGAAPVQLPRCVFTTGFVREYNAALGLSTPSAGAPAAGAAAAPRSAAALGAGLRESGVTQADILAHIADYGQRCRGVEAQLGRVLDYVEGER
ncbi:lysis protein [Alcaligenaceae bacterium]|nr:lysis protein [Alcaligenaceae bacterium]